MTKAYTVALAVALLGIHERLAMKIVRIISTAQADPCLIVTLTGSMGGPPTFNGLAGPGTLVQYGDISNNCNAVKLQFDAGRGTTCGYRRSARQSSKAETIGDPSMGKRFD